MAIKVTLDKDDLVSLITSLGRKTDPELSEYTAWEEWNQLEGEWVWDTDKLERLSEIELWALYRKIKPTNNG